MSEPTTPTGPLGADQPLPVGGLAIEQVLKILPHRYPLLLIDRVLALSAERAVCLKNVSVNEPYFLGHFPGTPVMPGVLQVEAMAQAGGILASRTASFDPATQVMMFMAIDAVKFRRPVTPGDQLIIEVVPQRTGKIFKMRGECRVDGKVVSSAELLAGVVDRAKVMG